MREARDETRRRRAVTPALGEHFMQRAAHQPALQHGVCVRMAKRHARKSTGLAFKAADAPPQGRKRVHARGSA